MFGIGFVSINAMKKILYTLVFIVPIVFVSCDNDEMDCDLSTHGTLIDYTGFDGCGVLVQTESETFEVINWEEMNFIPEDGMEICFDYNVEEARASICMMGQMITITDCQVLE
tara:strand:+ start:337 stop:675 length:339 start_codon:yes stop_codon:yes gene_type:complete